MSLETMELCVNIVDVPGCPSAESTDDEDVEEVSRWPRSIELGRENNWATKQNIKCCY